MCFQNIYIYLFHTTFETQTIKNKKILCSPKKSPTLACRENCNTCGNSSTICPECASFSNIPGSCPTGEPLDKSDCHYTCGQCSAKSYGGCLTCANKSYYNINGECQCAGGLWLHGQNCEPYEDAELDSVLKSFDVFTTGVVFQLANILLGV